MPLPRLQLFELEDLTWFPNTIRDLATDYLYFMAIKFSLHKPLVPLVREMLGEANTTHIVDLCSGGGGPMLATYKDLVDEGVDVHVTLTDRYPNIAAFGHFSADYPSGIQYITSPVDATSVPENLTGVRTIFNAFHHFAPKQARLVLESAVQARRPIGIFEAPERSLVMLISMLFTPIVVCVATPFIRPFQWKRLFWTYVLPLVPLTCLWDGMVSTLRAYTVAELLGMTNGLDAYRWRAGRFPVRGTVGHLTYLLGTHVL